MTEKENKMTEKENTFYIKVQQCARCGRDHDDLLFKPLKGHHDTYTHFATCPETDQPVLLYFSVTNDE